MSFIVDFKRKANDKLYGTKKPYWFKTIQVHSDSFFKCVLFHWTTSLNCACYSNWKRNSYPEIQRGRKETCNCRVKFQSGKTFCRDDERPCEVLFSVSTTTRDERLAFLGREDAFSPEVSLFIQKGLFTNHDIIKICALIYFLLFWCG